MSGPVCVSDPAGAASELDELAPWQPVNTLSTIVSVRTSASNFADFFIMIPPFCCLYSAALCARILTVYPFTAPMVTPLTKYFCKNGYSRMMGPVATTVMASFMGSLGTSLMGRPLRAAAAAMAWALVRILLR